MNKAKNLLKEEYLQVQKRWEYWYERSVLEDDEEVDTLERFWENVLQQIKLQINFKEKAEMKKIVVWEIWNTDGQYLGYYPEEEYALAVSYADSFNGYARVVKSYRYTEV